MTSAWPGYWLSEASGVLAPVVMKYLGDETLDEVEVATMRAYLRQWISADFRGPGIAELRVAVDGIRTHEDVTAWLERAYELGIDPL